MSVTVAGDGPRIEVDGSGPVVQVDVIVGGSGGGGGVTDHGALTGLADDDHTQYHTDGRGDARYPLKSNNLSDLASASTARTNLGLGNSATRNVGTASTDVASGDAPAAAVATHEADTTSVHGIADTSALVLTSDARLSNARTPTGAAGGDLTGTYPNPTIAPGAVVTAGLADGAVTSAKIADGAIVDADVSASAAIALSKLATDPLARANHTGTQAASTIGSGTIATARLGSGTANSTTFLRGDQTWATPTASVVQPGFPTLSGGIGSDNWALPPGLIATSTATTISVATGTAWIVPFLVQADITITAAAVRASATAAGSVTRCAIVRLNTTLQPTALTHEFATFDTATAGVKSQTGLSVTLTPGIYATYTKTEVAAPTLVYYMGLINPMMGATATLSAGGSLSPVMTASIGAGAYANPPAGGSAFNTTALSLLFLRWTQP